MQDNEKQYVTIMVQSLRDKKAVLDQIVLQTREQMDILKQNELDFDAYDVRVDKKTELISTLERLDDGFDSLYNKVQESLNAPMGRQKFQSEIKEMQSLITQITELSTTIQTMEARNKQLLESGFSAARRKLQGNRTTSKAAMDYYKNMRQTNVIAPQFLDSKN